MVIKKILRICLLQLLCLPFLPFALSGSDTDPGKLRTLNAGWNTWDPYQYLEESYAGEPSRLTGLDIQLTRAIMRQAGQDVLFKRIPWDQNLKELQIGQCDILMGALSTPEREKYAYVSQPYRKEINVLYIRRGEEKWLRFASVHEMLVNFKVTGFRLGAVRGFVVSTREINEYIRNYQKTPLIVPAENQSENFRNLLEGKIDGFIVDRVVGATMAWRQQKQKLVTEHPDYLDTGQIHLLLSKKSCSPETLTRINRAIIELEDSEKNAKIVRDYMFPVLLGITLEQPWFLIIDIIGTSAFAISGLLLARKERYSIFGAMVLGALPAFGGGVIRDLMINRNPIGLMRSPIYLYTVLATLAGGYFMIRLTEYITNKHRTRQQRGLAHHLFIRWRWVELFDAMGLSAFAIIGVVIAVEARCDPLWLWGPLLAVITGVGGGIIRDTIRSDHYISSLKGEFYPEVALIWGLLFSMFLQWQTTRLDPDEIFIGVVGCFCGGVLTRLAGIHFRLKGPMF